MLVKSYTEPLQLHCLLELKITMMAETIKGRYVRSESVFFKEKIT